MTSRTEADIYLSGLRRGRDQGYKQGQVDALTNAADEWCCHEHDGAVAVWLRARAERIGE
jgi:hypothetical protein